MKKWLCLALALLTLTVCLWAAAESTDWNYDLNYAILRGYNGAGGDVTVPAEIDLIALPAWYAPDDMEV